MELGPTKGCREAIACLETHCSLLKGSTSKDVLEVFYQEVGIRLQACVWNDQHSSANASQDPATTSQKADHLPRRRFSDHCRSQRLLLICRFAQAATHNRRLFQLEDARARLHRLGCQGSCTDRSGCHTLRGYISTGRVSPSTRPCAYLISPASMSSSNGEVTGRKSRKLLTR